MNKLLKSVETTEPIISSSLGKSLDLTSSRSEAWRICYLQLFCRAYQRIGSAYFKLNDMDQAIKFFNKSLTEHRTPETLTKLREAEKLKKDLEKQAYHNPELGEKAREEGNALFKKNDWPGAVAHYTEAIKRNEQDYKSYSNRAACYLKLMAVHEALKDAEKCIEIEPTFGKCFCYVQYHKV